jgi:hypothetical protein
VLPSVAARANDIELVPGRFGGKEVSVVLGDIIKVPAATQEPAAEFFSVSHNRHLAKLELIYKGAKLNRGYYTPVEASVKAGKKSINGQNPEEVDHCRLW